MPRYNEQDEEFQKHYTRGNFWMFHATALPKMKYKYEDVH